MSVKTDLREQKKDLQPGDLNQYIHLTSISLWLILGAVLVLVAGLTVWAFAAELPVTVKAVAVADGQSGVLYVPEDQISRIKADSELEISDVTTTVFGDIPNVDTSVPAGDVLDEYQLSLAGFEKMQKVINVSIDVAIPEGSYPASVIIENVRPIDFLFGGERKG